MLVKEKKELRPAAKPPGFDALIETLYITESKSMFYYAYGLLRNPGLAEVAVQDTFLTACQNPQAFFSCPKHKGWLYKTLGYIIKNALRDQQRAIMHTVSIEDAPDASLSRIDSYSSIPDDAANSEDMRLLHSFYVYGLTIQELAEQLGVSTGACKMRLKRARERLRKHLE